MPPKVTVLMPVYNGEAFLRPTMESIFAQTFTDFEFLVIDDGSTDDTVAIVRSFDDPRIRLLHNPKRLKLSGALNRGLDEAQGRYIARMDADDIALPQRLAKQVLLLDSSPEIGLCGTWIKRFGMGRGETNRFPETSEQVRAYALFDCPFAHPTVMIRKDFLDRDKLRYDGSYYPTEDYELWGRVLDLFPCVNIPEVLLHYRVHESSMTCSDWGEMDTKAAAVAGRQLKALLGHDLPDSNILFHRNIGRGESFSCLNFEELHRGEDWLIKLLQANSEHQNYGKAAFDEVVSLVWFRLCFHSRILGIKVLQIYLKSPLPKNNRSALYRTAILSAAIIKGRLLGSIGH